MNDLTDGQRARLDQAFALIRENSEKRIRESLNLLCSPRRSVVLSQRLERILRTTDPGMFDELSTALIEVAGAEAQVWSVITVCIGMLLECNNYRDGVPVRLFDPFAIIEDDDDDC